MSNTKKQTISLPRPPIVTVMGHVDHGKTSILDALRGARVAAGEEGGITQNTRAHQIDTAQGNKVTFIDTPGHEAFSAMRSRGAEVTDFVLLVVAANDGVQPQTQESIKFAQETNSPIIVAINKIDMEGTAVDKVKQQLSQHNVLIEEYGGDVMCFEVSAVEKIGLEDMIEGIELLAEVQQIKPHVPKENTIGDAYVLESSVHKSLGSVALCVLKSGQLQGKESGASSETFFRVRTYLDQNQKPTQEISESDPFWVTGIDQTLKTGEVIYFVNDKKEAEKLHDQLVVEQENEEEKSQEATDSANMLAQLVIQKEMQKEGVEQKQLNVVLRTSTVGTLEVAEAELEKIGDEDKTINLIDSGTGPVTEQDIDRAKTASGIVISFQQNLSKQVEKIAKQENVIVRNYGVIYEMVEELGAALSGLIEPEEVEQEIARAQIKEVFELSNGSLAAGCEVIKGKIVKGYSIYVERPTESTTEEIAEIARGKITELRVHKEKVKEVKKGQECGILIEPNPEGLEKGDEIVAFKMEKQ